MLFVSTFTMFLGLTEPLFVPEYWSPPSLFNLNQKTGFDIESLVFAFAVGGIASALYELIFKEKHKSLRNFKHYHLFYIISAPVIFFSLILLFPNFNTIYSAIISMSILSISTIICRPDLKKKIFISGFLFLLFYFIFFLAFNFIYPNFVNDVYNFQNISRLIILGIPIEELVYAFFFGLSWSSLYEQSFGYRLKKS